MLHTRTISLGRALFCCKLWIPLSQVGLVVKLLLFLLLLECLEDDLIRSWVCIFIELFHFCNVNLSVYANYIVTWIDEKSAYVSRCERFLSVFFLLPSFLLFPGGRNVEMFTLQKRSELGVFVEFLLRASLLGAELNIIAFIFFNTYIHSIF